jgi:hypothetical protein
VPYIQREYQAILAELGTDLGGSMAALGLGLGLGLPAAGSGGGPRGLAGGAGASSAASATFEVADQLARDLEGESDEDDGDDADFAKSERAGPALGTAVPMHGMVEGRGTRDASLLCFGQHACCSPSWQEGHRSTPSGNIRCI